MSQLANTSNKIWGGYAVLGVFRLRARQGAGEFFGGAGRRRSADLGGGGTIRANGGFPLFFVGSNGDDAPGLDAPMPQGRGKPPFLGGRRQIANLTTGARSAVAPPPPPVAAGPVGTPPCPPFERARVFIAPRIRRGQISKNRRIVSDAHAGFAVRCHNRQSSWCSIGSGATVSRSSRKRIVDKAGRGNTSTPPLPKRGKSTLIGGFRPVNRIASL